MQASQEKLLWMYQTMVEIRNHEVTMVNVYLQDKLPPRIQKGLAFDIGSGPVPGEMHLAARRDDGRDVWQGHRDGQGQGRPHAPV